VGTRKIALDKARDPDPDQAQDLDPDQDLGPSSTPEAAWLTEEDVALAIRDAPDPLDCPVSLDRTGKMESLERMERRVRMAASLESPR
jgi:hypothetical protein